MQFAGFRNKEFKRPLLFLFFLINSLFAPFLSRSHLVFLLSPMPHPLIYSVSQKSIPLRFSDIFPKRLGIFSPHFTHLLHVPIYARVQIFIQLPTTLTKLRHIKCDHRVHIMCSKCPPSAETHAFRRLKVFYSFVDRCL